VFDFSKKQWREGRRENGGTGGGVGPLGEGTGEGLCPLSRKFLIFFFHFRIVHSGVFSYNNLKFYLQSHAGKGTSSRYSLQLTVILT